MTIPGVGALTAVTYLTTIDDPDRFHRSRDVGAHVGLTPRKYAFGEVDRNGAISKWAISCFAGPSTRRRSLYSPDQKYSALKAWGMAVAKRRGLGRAIIAVSRKLAIIMHRIWSDVTEFRWSKEPAASAAA